MKEKLKTWIIEGLQVCPQKLFVSGIMAAAGGLLVIIASIYVAISARRAEYLWLILIGAAIIWFGGHYIFGVKNETIVCRKVQCVYISKGLPSSASFFTPQLRILFCDLETGEQFTTSIWKQTGLISSMINLLTSSLRIDYIEGQKYLAWMDKDTTKILGAEYLNEKTETEKTETN